MSVRYGDRERSGLSTPSAGRRPGPTNQVHQTQTFNSPGTWTWPGNVTHVQVLLVGGGGGGAAQGIPTASTPLSLLNASGSGGGGGVRYEWEVPVNGPVPITIGAGGAGGTGGLPNPLPTYTFTNAQVFGQIGGDTSFGPITVGGGGGGGHPLSPKQPLVPTYCNAPANGGGAGSAMPSTSGGSYGCDRYRPSTTPSPSVQNAAGAGSQDGLGRFGYGQGGRTSGVPQIGPLVTTAGASAPANSGAGGNGYNTGTPGPGGLGAGGSGGSGVVIVSWWE